MNTLREAMKRQLTYDERAVWGTCPICGAKMGQPCDGSIGYYVGCLPNKLQGGAHMGRLQAAPFEIEVSGAVNQLIDIQQGRQRVRTDADQDSKR